MKLSHADLSFNLNGTPQSDTFGDVYFSNKDGITESEYVFLKGNKLWQQWCACEKSCFYIGETGFGTGLNLLLTMKLFDEFLSAYPQARLKHLHYISVEKYPIERNSLAKIHQNWPQLHQYSQSVLQQYPPALEGIHRSFYSSSNQHECITFDLVLGDAITSLNHIHADKDGFVNAWFLDGFAPSKNDSMWQAEMFEQIARLSSLQASLATFTAAGAVKRSLQAVGFTVSKIKGFGRKREMIVASYTARKSASVTRQAQPPYFTRRQDWPKPAAKSIAIVGAGIAGVLLAMRLTECGVRVTLICKDNGPARGASGNAIAGFYPQLNAEAGINSQFFVHAFLYARRFYDALLDQGYDFDHDWCSVLQLGFNENTQTRLQKMADKALWPKELATIVDAIQASEIAGIDIPHPALHLPQGGWIAPISMIHACLQKAEKTGLLNTLYSHSLHHYDESESAVQLSLLDPQSKQKCLSADALIIAAGSESSSVCQQFVPMRLTRGQVESIPQGESTGKLKAVLCHKGYFTPAVDGYHALGSTYVKGDMNTEHRLSETVKNIAMHQQAAAQTPWMQEITKLKVNNINGRAAVRCSTPDHLPLVGAMPDIIAQTQALSDLYKALPNHAYPHAKNVNNVYLLTGLGSRGVTSAPILVDTLVAEITGRAFPLSTALLDALMPNRFLVRALIRQSAYENEASGS